MDREVAWLSWPGVIAIEAPVLRELALLFGLCVVVAVAFHRLRLPPAAGFLFAGALVGPHGLGLVHETRMVHELAEIGVVVLLFTVGLELSWKEMLHARRAVLVGGGLQIALTMLLGAALGFLGGLAPGPAVFVGALLCLSSTAVVTRLLADTGQLASPTGRLGVSICVAQDLAVVPMIALLPVLGASGSRETTPGRFLTGVVILVAVLGAVRLALPYLLRAVERTRSREVFVLSVAALCTGLALLAAQVGMSAALGAFLAGLMLSGSEHRYQAVGEFEPFRDLLSSLFFVSIGMLFDPMLMLSEPLLVVGALAAVLAGKSLVVLVVARILRFPPWIGWRAAALLAQVGEFSFVLLDGIRGRGVVPASLEQVFPIVAVLSIGATPPLFALAHRWTTRRAPETDREQRPPPETIQDHVVVAGFGAVGHAVATALARARVPFVGIEMNAQTVRRERARGAPVLLGDATRPFVLRAAGIERARLLVLTVNDPGAVRRAALVARRIVPGIRVIARAIYSSDVPQLWAAGVNDIVSQELETSVEILARVLHEFLIPSDEIGRRLRQLRREAFDIPKKAPPPEPSPHHIADWVPGLAVEVFAVGAGSEADGKNLAELRLRQRTGWTVVARKRGEETTAGIDADTRLQAGDILVVIGPSDRREEIALVLRAPAETTEPVES